MNINGAFEFSVDSSAIVGKRLDTVVASHIPRCSRSYAATLVRQGNITVEGRSCKPSYKVKLNDRIYCSIPAPEPIDVMPELIPLDILFEDQAIIALNKPAGLVIHPAAGHRSGTLVNGLLHHCPHLEGIGGKQRPGIVHRLDKNTSGVLVVAKTAMAHHDLARQFKQRQIGKKYKALVYGVPDRESGSINLPIGRHPVDRKKMAANSPKSRTAITSWRISERFENVTLLDVDLKTGRTHQIRVHCLTMGHPIVGDPVYTRRRLPAIYAKCRPDLYVILKQVQRQMLHAAQLTLAHPYSGQQLTFEAPLPGDMAEILRALNLKDAQSHMLTAPAKHL